MADPGASAFFVAAGGRDAEPGTTGLELSGDLGSLGSSAMGARTIALHLSATNVVKNLNHIQTENAAKTK
jgi:hypothetical protein